MENAVFDISFKNKSHKKKSLTKKRRRRSSEINKTGTFNKRQSSQKVNKRQSSQKVATEAKEEAVEVDQMIFQEYEAQVLAEEAQALE